MAGQREVDAVLRGEAPPTPEIEQMIANLDGALAGRPTPDPVVVWFASDEQHLGGFEGLADRLITEPTFLMTHLDTPESDYGDAAVVLKLRVPAGTPAVFLAAEPVGVLMLARGLRWKASRVVSQRGTTFVFGAVEG
jgi:hypothetical protein